MGFVSATVRVLLDRCEINFITEHTRGWFLWCNRFFNPLYDWSLGYILGILVLIDSTARINKIYREGLKYNTRLITCLTISVERYTTSESMVTWLGLNEIKNLAQVRYDRDHSCVKVAPTLPILSLLLVAIFNTMPSEYAHYLRAWHARSHASRNIYEVIGLLYLKCFSQTLEKFAYFFWAIFMIFC